MEKLDQILQRATADIESIYFHLPIDGGDPIYRERVYCYELYHRMRVRWPPDTDYCLNGEIDKAGHPLLAPLGAAHAKPDFLVHVPGDMNRNHAIIEVKAANASPAAIRTDLDKLTLFVNGVGYDRAIYLIYGWSADSAIVQRIAVVAQAMPALAQIEIWLHEAPRHAANCLAATLAVEPEQTDLDALIDALQ